MAKPRLTPWFPASVKPVREGVYQVQDVNGGCWWSRWYCGRWHSGFALTEKQHYVLAASMSCNPAPVPRKLWRGLASPPKGAQ